MEHRSRPSNRCRRDRGVACREGDPAGAGSDRTRRKAGRARARKRAADALLAGVSAVQIAKLDQLLAVDREIGLYADAATQVHDNRFQQLIREGRISEAHQLGRYAAHRRRAILAANIIDSKPA